MALLGVARTVGAAGALAVLVAGAGCSASSGDRSVGPDLASSSADTTPTPAPTATAPTATAPTATPTPTVPSPDPHAVPPPGPRQPGVVAPADIVVTRAETIDRSTVRAIRRVRGVTGLARISLAQAVVENRALSVAAVDPGIYRTFVARQDADFAEAWDRVAGGELALKTRLKDSVPLDAEGYLRLGGAIDAPRIHVGAYVAQQPLVDAVVNQTWVGPLGMTPDNALLIRTGQNAPAPVARRIERLLGSDSSVQLVDKATRTGLDPSALQIAVVTGTVADAVGVYRYTVGEGERITPDPAWVRDHIVTQTVPILGAVTCNRVIFPQLIAALEEVVARGLSEAIHPGQFAGCYYPRFIAGTTTLSNHAFGLALDLNAVENQRGTSGRIDRAVVEIFERWGFTWGGRWRYTDPMHFELNAVIDPR